MLNLLYKPLSKVKMIMTLIANRFYKNEEQNFHISISSSSHIYNSLSFHVYKNGGYAKRHV